jgi:hypothetical protein
MDLTRVDDPPAYPLAIGPTGRYFVDQNGRPVLVQGDAAWSIMVAPTREGVEHYLDNIAAKGFNAILANLIESHFSPDPPGNRYGDAPFTSPGDFATPNEPYMAHVDWVIRQAERRGILVFLVPSYLGYPVPHMSHGATYGYDSPEGWFAEVLANGVDGCREYGRYLGRRYRDFSNVVWTIGGDRNPDEALMQLRAMAAGVQEADDRHLFAAHVLPEAFPFDQYPADPWLAIDFTYSYQIVHAALMQHYLRAEVHPNILIESTYERDGNNASDAQIRRQAYWAILCGAGGQFIGSSGIWDFAPGWESLLDSPARVAQAHFHDVFGRYKWWELVPDLSRSYAYTGVAVGHAWHDPTLKEFISAGVGELKGLDFASAARAPDGHLAIVYLPTARAITIELGQLRGPGVTATWFDPITGSSAPAGDWPTSQPQEFSPPSAQDWVLVIEARD